MCDMWKCHASDFWIKRVWVSGVGVLGVQEEVIREGHWQRQENDNNFRLQYLPFDLRGHKIQPGGVIGIDKLYSRWVGTKICVTWVLGTIRPQLFLDELQRALFPARILLSDFQCKLLVINQLQIGLSFRLNFLFFALWEHKIWTCFIFNIDIQFWNGLRLGW